MLAELAAVASVQRDLPGLGRHSFSLVGQEAQQARRVSSIPLDHQGPHALGILSSWLANGHTRLACLRSFEKHCPLVPSPIVGYNRGVVFLV